MKFKKGDRVEFIGGKSGGFTKGKIYIVSEDDLDKDGYVCIKEDDKSSNTNGHYPKYFKLIEENKMKTSKEMQLKILDKMKSNIDNNLPMCNGIEYYSYRTQKWHTPEAIDFENLEYRLKPETITLKNGVVIPKYLSHEEMNFEDEYYFPDNCSQMFYGGFKDSALRKGVLYPYKTKEEAIEASKALFGIK